MIELHGDKDKADQRYTELMTRHYPNAKIDLKPDAKIVQVIPMPTPDPKPAEVKPDEPKIEAKPEAKPKKEKPKRRKAKAKPAEVKPDEPKIEAKPEEVKPEAKPAEEVKPEAKPDAKPDAPTEADERAALVALLGGSARETKERIHAITDPALLAKLEAIEAEESHRRTVIKLIQYRISELNDDDE
tara:strand:- start:223 stop:783 length:561 start_codon:yes stop_codon:yes gene_type:complete